jgi:hypothetical protein
MDKQPSKILTYLLPSFRDILWMAAFFGVLLRGRQMINADGDLALHLNLGKYILDTRTIPLRDPFSHTLTGQPVIQHEWLSAVIFEGIKRVFGLEGVIFLCALVISGTIFLLYTHLRSKSQTLLPVLLVVFLTLINSIVHWLARPHIFSFLLLTIWLITLDRLRFGKTNNWWFLPGLMLLWVNIHGGFIIGFIVWIIYGIGVVWDILFDRLEQEGGLTSNFWRYYLLGGAASILASLINPSGIRLWTRVLGHVGNRYLADITQEFQSPNFHDVTYWPFLIYILLLVVGLGLSKKKNRSEILFNGTAWLLMGLYSIRNIPLFAIVAAPLLTLALEDLLINAPSSNKLGAWIKGLDGRFQNLNRELKGYFWPVFSILIAILGLSLGYRFDLEGKGYAFDPEVFPVQAVNWLQDNPQEGEMFNYFTWGGYLEYRLWPVERVFIDSKSDFYGEDFVRQYMRVILLEEGWEKVLDQYDVSWAILPTDERAAKAIKEELGWEVVYKDNTAVILIRQ